MARFEIVTVIHAPIDICFDLSRDIDFHQKSLAHTGERAVAGVTSGLIELGESVTWQAWHLGFVQRLTSEVTALDRPHSFQDRMTKGDFKSFVHDHVFIEDDGVTTMKDVVDFESPGWIVGRLVDRYFLAGYLRRLLEARACAIRDAAELRTEQAILGRFGA